VTGFLPEADLHRTIAEARAVLYLSAYEGYGFVPSEATVLGTHSFVYDLPPYRERAAQLSATAVPIDDTSALARELIGYLRADRPEVTAEPPPRWAETAEAYRALAERVLPRDADRRRSTGSSQAPGPSFAGSVTTVGIPAARAADVVSSLYPEMAAGGFSRVDGAVAFYTRVGALLEAAGPGALVVDFGSGRGACLDDPVPYRRRLRLLRGRGARVVGVDIDPAVLENQAVDEGHVVEVGGKLPFDDGSVDLVVSDYAFEHVTDPAWAAAEIDRVLRPGGWLCVKTPNRWGYIGLAARAVPNRFHVRLLRRLQPGKPADDTFPTAYLLNTPRDLRRWFPPGRFRHVVWAADSEPAYAGASPVLAHAGRAAFVVTPPPLRSVLYAFLQKA
jgi:SAM-dependent methyltransferase